MLNSTHQIISITELLKQPLSIPDYQRPYKWTTQNIADLTSDIDYAISESKRHNSFKYRIGTIILHNNGKQYDIVDGQQRCISLLLIYYGLYGKNLHCSLLKKHINSVGVENIYNNYLYIHNWLLKTDEEKKEIIQAFDKILECVVLVVKNEKEAFQLFDSQNSRGKELYPHDLLKAYHLREMQSSSFDMIYAVEKWEAIAPKTIKKLFATYLFPILKWSRKEKSKTFTSKDIDVYKGIKESSAYSYAKRTNYAMPVYQISEPFISGNDFFEMVAYYVRLLDYVKQQTENKIKDIDSSGELLEMFKSETSKGFAYTKELCECALLFYFDKFKMMDNIAVKNILTWAFMLRVDLETLSLASINNYAIGNESQYSNNLPLFSIIKNARTHTEIGALKINIRKETRGDNYKRLLHILRNINGYD